MIYINLSAATAASSPLSFTVDLNTNSYFKASSNSITIMCDGLYEITGTATCTSTASGSFGISINDVQYVNSCTTAGETFCIPVYQVINVVKNTTGTYAVLNIEPINEPTIVSGSVSIKRII